MLAVNNLLDKIIFFILIILCKLNSINRIFILYKNYACPKLNNINIICRSPTDLWQVFLKSL